MLCLQILMADMTQKVYPFMYLQSPNHINTATPNLLPDSQPAAKKVSAPINVPAATATPNLFLPHASMSGRIWEQIYG